MMLIDSGNISENLISRKLVDCFGLACETGKLPLKSRICTRVPFLSKSVRDPRTEKIRNLDGTIMRGQGDMVTIRWSGVNDATISDPIVVFRETFYETRHRIVDSCMDDVVLQFQEVYRLRLREQRTGAAGHIVKPPTFSGQLTWTNYYQRRNEHKELRKQDRGDSPQRPPDISSNSSSKHSSTRP